MISYNYHIIMQEILEAGERLDRGCRDACLSYGDKQKKNIAYFPGPFKQVK